MRKRNRPDRNSIPVPPHESEPVETQTSAAGRPRRLGRHILAGAKRGALPIALTLVAAGAVTAFKAQTWNNKINTYKKSEEAMFKYQASKGLKCLNAAVLLKAGVVYRNTPAEVNDRLPVIMKGTKAGTIGKGKEMLVKRPIVATIDGATWYGFNPHNPSADTASQTAPSVQTTESLAGDITWVNYSKLAVPDGSTKDDDTLVSEISLKGTTGSGIIDCSIAEGSIVTTSGHMPAAFTIGVVPNGVVQKISHGLDGRS